MKEIAFSLISLATWLTPMPRHAEGLLVTYGPQWLIESNAEWHVYDLRYYRQRCGVSVMSPSNLGKIVWLRVDNNAEWYGPCLAIDVSQRDHFYRNVYINREIAEVSHVLRDRFRFKYGSSAWGYAFVGLCPDEFPETPRRYAPALSHDATGSTLVEIPSQQLPVRCDQTTRRK